MSVLPGVSYIQNLSHASSEELKPVKAMGFYAALEATYGEDATCAGSKALLQQPEKFAGVRAFKERIIEAISSDTEISPDDQKYIENWVHRTALTSLSQARR